VNGAQRVSNTPAPLSDEVRTKTESRKLDERAAQIQQQIATSHATRARQDRDQFATCGGLLSGGGY